MPTDVTAYETAEWHDLFVASAGASAALAGLVFVAVSIKVRKILEFEGLPERANQTVMVLLAAVVVSLFGLIPQEPSTLGYELLIGGLAILAWLAATSPRVPRAARGHPVRIAIRLIVVVPGSLPYAIGGLSLVLGTGGGLGWVAAGIIGALVGAVINAWVLLVEIPLGGRRGGGQGATTTDQLTDCPARRTRSTNGPLMPEKKLALKRECLRRSGDTLSELRQSTPERMTGIEPAFSAWEADVLPLNYIRTHTLAGLAELTRPRG
jgi:hypothetical protein